MKILIRNGHVIDPANKIDARNDVFIAAGRIVGVGQAPNGFTANRTIDADRLIVAPGLIDLSARLREPGFEHKATLESELTAAVAGGITSLACPPDTEPPLDEPGLVEMLKHRARNLNLAHVYPHGALTIKLKGQTLTEMGELAEAGCVAFSQANTMVQDTQVLLRALQYAATFGHSVWLQPQDSYLARRASPTMARSLRVLDSQASRCWPRRWQSPPFCSSCVRPAYGCTSRGYRAPLVWR